MSKLLTDNDMIMNEVGSTMMVATCHRAYDVASNVKKYIEYAHLISTNTENKIDYVSI